jgi:large subunit ribosomal protein L24
MENKADYKFKVKVGDKVKVIAGNAKGSSGVVKAIIREKQRVVIEGVNMVSKHVKPTAQQPEGGIVQKEAGIHISNVAIIDPKTNQTTRVGRKQDANGKLKRYSKKSQQFID